MKGPVKIAYIDVLQCLLVVFFIVMLFSTPKKEEAKGNIIDPSQFIAELTWTDFSPNDVDLWMENPNGQIVYFGEDTFGGMTLDTDNLGLHNEVMGPNGDKIPAPARREVLSIRTPIAGTYTVNIMFYTNNTGLPEKAKIHVFKLNPYKEVIEKEVVLTFKGEESTVVQFEIDDKGNLLSVNTSPEPVSLFGKLHP